MRCCWRSSRRRGVRHFPLTIEARECYGFEEGGNDGEMEEKDFRSSALQGNKENASVRIYWSARCE